MATTKLICVYCGACSGKNPAYAEAAAALGSALVDRGYGLVYGGTQAGLMSVVSEAVLERGGKVVGVIPELLSERDLARPDCTELILAGSMHERKATMVDLAEAVVVLPGGIGTLDEFFEVLTWRDLGLHSKPIALLDVEGYWERLRWLLENCVEQGFARAEIFEGFRSFDDPGALLDALPAWPPASLPPRWSRTSESS